MKKLIILLMSLLLTLGSISVSFCNVENVDEGMIKVKVVPSVSSAKDGEHITFEFRIDSIPNNSKLILKSMEAVISYDTSTLDVVQYKKGASARDGFSFDKGIFKLSAFKENDIAYEENEVLFSMEMKVKEGTDVRSCSMDVNKMVFFNDTENGKSIYAETTKDTVKLIKSWDVYTLKGAAISPIGVDNEHMEILIGDKSIYSKSISSVNGRIPLDNEGIIIDMTEFTSTSKSTSALDYDKLPAMTIKIGTMIYKKKLSVSDLKIDAENHYSITLSDVELVQGDVNKDMTIDMKDADLLSIKVGSNTSDHDLDINRDGKIDIKDLFYISKSYGY